MLAIVAAVVFGLALLVDLTDTTSEILNLHWLGVWGLLLLALHAAGVGAKFNWRSRSPTAGAADDPMPHTPDRPPLIVYPRE